MQRKIFVMLLLGSFLTGCTNYLYQGRIKAEDSAGKQRDVVLYWTKTDPMIGDAKADMAHVLTECGALVVFENRPEGIVFRGDPQRDRLAAFATITAQPSQTMECGRILHRQRLTDLGQGKVALTIRCEPKSNEFSVKPLTYIKAQESAYEFDVRENKQWSLLGSVPEVPAVPTCQE